MVRLIINFKYNSLCMRRISGPLTASVATNNRAMPVKWTRWQIIHFAGCGTWLYQGGNEEGEASATNGLPPVLKEREWWLQVAIYSHLTGTLLAPYFKYIPYISHI
jgi:hypothetical protein